MSIVYSTACLDCGVFAPEVGAFGYIGYPSADTSRGQEGVPPNFGYLYEAFAGIRLITWHLSLLHEFFQRHAGHHIHTFADGDPLFGSGGASAAPPEPGDDALRPYALQEAAWTDAAAAAYPLARFRVHCAKCVAEYLSGMADNILGVSPVVLTAESIGRFRERIQGQLDSFTFMNAAPLDTEDVEFPNLAALLLFLANHTDHPLSASTVLDETS
jgi:hypothetical protein